MILARLDNVTVYRACAEVGRCANQRAGAARHGGQ